MDRPLSAATVEALRLLGTRIRLARRERRMSERSLAERIGVARSTVQRIEGGDAGVAIGLALEAAVIVGLPLFGTSDAAALGQQRDGTQARLALIPDPPRGKRPTFDDDF